MKNFVALGVMIVKGRGKFWEISVVGSDLLVREGKVGERGKEKKTECADRSSAHAQAERLIAEQTTAGFRMYPVKPLPDTEDARSATGTGVKSVVHAPAPPAWLALEKQFYQICERIYEPYREELTDALGPRFKMGAWAWVPESDSRHCDEIDRLGDVVLGPLFTCQAYEWPYRDELPMAPLIQLDLVRASQMSGLPLGNGLVQVWMPHKAVAGADQFVRVVPRAVVDRAGLTPVPAMPSEVDPLQSIDAEAPAFQIVSWGDKRYTTPLAQGFQSYYKLKQLTTDPAIAKEIKAFDQTLAALVQGSSAPFSPVNAHLFGTFAEIQYAPQDCPQPLFCFDGGAFGLEWGDAGNAQLFYSIGAAGEVSFSFDWSGH